MKDPYVSSMDDDDPTLLPPANAKGRVSIHHLFWYMEPFIEWAFSKVGWHQWGCIFLGVDGTPQIEGIEADQWDVRTAEHPPGIWAPSRMLIVEGGVGSGGWNIDRACVEVCRDLLAETNESR